MTIKITQTFESFTITVEADREDKLIEKLAFWNDLPSKCPMCGALLRFAHRQPQGFDYFGFVCEGEVQHECTFGIKKEDHSLFYKANSWRKLGPPDPQSQPEPQYRQSNPRQDAPQGSRSAPHASQSIDPDDLPWDDADGSPEQPDPFDWGDFLAQCRGVGVSGRWVRAVVGGDPQQPISSLKDILPWLTAQPNRSIASLVSQAATLRDAKKP